MRLHLLLAATVAIGALLCANAANAGTYDPALDQTITVNNGDPILVTGSPAAFSVDLAASPHTVVGLSFQGTLFVDPLAFPALPRHTQLTITAPNSTIYVLGGDPPTGAAWDFQAATGTFNVTYNHGLGGDAWGGDGLPDFGLPDSPLGGTWQFSFLRVGNPFPTTLQWSNVSITLHSIPTPGTAVMLALGVVGYGRRRRR